MAQSAIQAAIQQICQEKNLSEESVLRTIESALAAAYRKDFGNKMQNIIVNFDAKTGGLKVFDIKTVVEDLPEGYEESLKEEELKIKTSESEGVTGSAVVEGDEDVRKFNPRTEIQLKDAQALDKKHEIGDEIVTELEVPGEFGRMAAQTAKQVIIQKIREEERQNIFDEYKALEHEVLIGSIQRKEGRNILVDLSHTTAIMPIEEQVERERYSVGNRMKFYLKSVELTNKGPQIVVSRSHVEIVKKIFESEIPEIANGAIEIKGIVREAGSRSKVAISSSDESIDPIGSCVGQRGSRIQTIISELNNEKVDIILWDENAEKFIINALSPAHVLGVELHDEEGERNAIVKVKEDQLSLAIGRGGQNVRLASKLTGWKIDIISEEGKVLAGEEGEGDVVDEKTDTTDEEVVADQTEE
ncbi:MAG: transcription termination factor NusA [Candidatus Buchananbacteria bacterium]